MRKKAKSLLCILIMTALLISILGVQASADAPRLNTTSLELAEGRTSQLTVSGYSGHIQWVSSNSAIVEVNSNGAIRARGVGTATISARAGNETLRCRVTVLTNKIIPAQSRVSVEAGKRANVRFRIDASVNDIAVVSSANTVAKASFNAETNILTVNGIKAGTASIRVFSRSNNRINRIVSVTVTEAPVAVTTPAAVTPPETKPEQDEPAQDSSPLPVTTLATPPKRMAETASAPELLLWFINEERAKQGVKTLVGDKKLNDAATTRINEVLSAEEMEILASLAAGSCPEQALQRWRGANRNTLESVLGKHDWKHTHEFRAWSPGKNKLTSAEFAAQTIFIRNQALRDEILNPKYTRIGIGISSVPSMYNDAQIEWRIILAG